MTKRSQAIRPVGDFDENRLAPVPSYHFCTSYPVIITLGVWVGRRTGVCAERTTLVAVPTSNMPRALVVFQRPTGWNYLCKSCAHGKTRGLGKLGVQAGLWRPLKQHAMLCYAYSRSRLTEMVGLRRWYPDSWCDAISISALRRKAVSSGAGTGAGSGVTDNFDVISLLGPSVALHLAGQQPLTGISYTRGCRLF